MSPYLLLLGPGLIAFVAWVVRATVIGRMDALEKKIDAVDAKWATSAQGQGKRIGDLESWAVAAEAVEKERRRAREDTRGVPLDEGKRGRGR